MQKFVLLILERHTAHQNEQLHTKNELRHEEKAVGTQTNGENKMAPHTAIYNMAPHHENTKEKS
jgi:hypothetical protein